jgi:PPM family protein phosphatase
MTAALEIAAGTHSGVVRTHNEDCLATSSEYGFAVLADGMGGHNAGEVASRMAVDVIASGLEAAIRALARPVDRTRAENLISEHVADANTRILEAGQQRLDHAGMGTTVIVALWHETSVSVGHIGDSRMYRLRARELRQLTRDHSLAQEHIDRGTLSEDEARAAGIRSILTRTLGNAPHVAVELNTFDSAEDDLYLLCSDGLTDMLTDEQICAVLSFFGVELNQAVEQLIQHANEQGGIDNISVILVRQTSAVPRGTKR